ncbi:MAG: RelA/SpoT domain-containing protein [Bacteroidota bacterium]
MTNQRKYSNRQINFAGQVLKEPNKYKVGDLREAEDILTYWRTIHAYPINTFQSTLRDKIIRLDIQSPIVAQRLKRAVSIVAKLERFDQMKLSTMQDIAGLRAIVKSVTDVRKLEKNYKESSFKHNLKGYKDYVTEPAISGYRGIHLIYEFVSENNAESNGLRIELQIRSKLQHTWATAVETVGTFLESSLKSSQGPTEWLNYFGLVSAGFSILENCPISHPYKMISNIEIFERISDETKQLKVHDKLKAFTVAADHINQKLKNSKYNLITLNLEKKTVNVKSYFANQLKRANKDYTGIERKINEGAPLQVVLVSTGSIDNLRKAYPSYFLDTKEFLQKLDLIENRLAKL